MTLQEVAQAAEIDLPEVMARFGNMEKLVVKFLKKFPQDKTYAQLAQAVADNDYPTIETAAHTLKGVAGNLGFTGLFHLNQEIVDAVRGGNYGEISALFEKDREMYEKIVQIVEQLD